MILKMIKYLIISLIVVLTNIISCVNSQAIIESELINSLPFNGTNYLNLLSLVDSRVRSKTGIGNTTQMILNIKEMKNYLNKDLPPLECELNMNLFRRNLSNYIECLLVNEVPFYICLSCANSYVNLYNSYKQLTNTSISKCPNDFLSGTKISILNNFYINSITQWTDRNCDNCYKAKHPEEDFVLNEDTIYYYYLSNNYLQCVKNKEDLNITNTTCCSCKQTFNRVNDYYDLITSNYSSQVCYDIVDEMKDIRQHWSLSLQCPEMSTQTLHILGIIMLVLMLPFFLYLTGRLFCADKNKTLMRQKRLATSYSYVETESAPLMNPLEK